jgi:triosephosphate isomerase
LSRKTIVAGNWKLNKTVGETRQLIRELKNRLAGIDSSATVVVCPPMVALETAVDAARDTGIAVGAQNVYWEASGAFTGEVSPAMLEAVGVEYVLIGHSERRTIFGETDGDVNRKLRAVLRSDLAPVICLGESLGQREAGETEAVVRGQLGAGLEGVAPDHAGRLIIAYEPIWAIGTGKTATPEMANDVHRLIRRTVADMFGGLAADGMSLLYGGSVKPESAGSLMAEGEIDGVLVGGASLDDESFAEIVRAAP